MRDYPDVKNSSLECVEESKRQQLVRIRKNLTDKMADIDRALALLERNPEIEELTDLLRRI